MSYPQAGVNEPCRACVPCVQSEWQKTHPGDFSRAAKTASDTRIDQVNDSMLTASMVGVEYLWPELPVYDSQTGTMAGAKFVVAKEKPAMKVHLRPRYPPGAGGYPPAGAPP
jgi:hypothetical protein